MPCRRVKASDIAVAYGVTEKHVYRRVALSGLPAEVLDALQAEEINLSQAAAFTISDDQTLSLAVLEQVKERGKNHWQVMSDHQIKKALKPEAVNADNDRRAAYVGLEAYQAAGGRVGGDLFAEETMLDDPSILDDVFAAKLAEAAEAYTAEHGLKWTRPIMDDFVYRDYGQDEGFGRLYPVEQPLTDAEADRYDKLEERADEDGLHETETLEFAALQAKIDGQFTEEQKAFCGAVLYVDYHGNQRVYEGLVDPDDCADAEAAGILEKSKHKPATTAKKNPLSEALRSDLHRMETGARQNPMLDDPKLALHLFAFQLSGLMDYATAFGLRKDDVPNVPATETGYELDKRLSTPVKAGEDDNRADAFAVFRKRGDNKIMEILNRYLVSQLSIGDTDLGAMIDTLTKKNTRDTFTPTAENFFKRVGGSYMEQLWVYLLELPADHPTATSFAKLKKGEKAAKMEKLFADPETRKAVDMTDAQEARIAAWLPEGMV